METRTPYEHKESHQGISCRDQDKDPSSDACSHLWERHGYHFYVLLD